VNFLHDLRRRRMFRLIGLYVVGAWVVIQVAEALFQAWGIPDTAMRFVFIGAFLCFPIALVFGWIYDITSEGIVRTRAAHADEAVDLTLRRSDYIVLTALLAVGAAVLVGSADKIQEEIEAGPAIALDARWRENSIAVLPFTNLDINADTGFFSDGITEEILHRLASLGVLHVLASNSSFAFRDSEESPAEIREKLGVRYLLQGSIRREDDYVRVTARLIDEGGFQLWSESFDRKLEGIFAIQTEIASTVASEIINEIVPLQELPAGRTTANMEAYNEFLVGKAFLDARTVEWRDRAVQAFEKAIELDPGFALPRAGLAMAITVNTPPGPSWREARQLAEKAVQLDPDLAEAHAALGIIHMGAGRLNQSSLSSRRALKLDPSLGFAYNILAAALDGMGRVDEANDARQKGLAVDPLNPPLVANVASEEARAGNFDRAEQLLMRLISLPQPPPLAFQELYFQYDKQGRFAEAVAIAKQVARLDAPSGDAGAVDLLAWAYGNLGMTEDADYWTGLVLGIQQDDLGTLDFTYNVLRTRAADSELGAQLQQLVNQTEFLEGEHHPWTLAQFGLVNIQLGNFEEGAEQLEYGIRLMQAAPNQTEPANEIDISAFRADPADIVYVMHLLAFALQEVGDVTAANNILQDLTSEFGLENHALHQALLGNTEGALHILQTMTGSGWSAYYGPGKYYEIINDPAWAETIEAPEFQALLDEIKDEIDRQRAIVEAVDAEHDFRAEVQQLLAN